MAQQLYVSDGTLTSNLLSTLYVASEGLEIILDDEWINIRIKTTAAASTIRTQLNYLDQLKAYALRYANPIESRAVWLYMQSEGETLKRRLVEDITYEIQAMGRLTPLLATSGAWITISIKTRMPWEATSATNVNTASISTLGGTWTPSSAAGTLEQRATDLFISKSAGGQIYKGWLGMRPTRNGTTGFISLWEAELGTVVSSTDTSIAADATASPTTGNTKMTTTFATYPEMLRRFSLTWSQVQASNYDDMIGEYLVLARLKLGASTEIVIDLRHGWGGHPELAASLGQNFLSSTDNTNLTSWNLVGLGRAIVPPTGNRDGVGANLMATYMLSLFAERVSGSGALDIDCFIFVPAERLMEFSGANINSSGGRLYLYTGPDDLQYVVDAATGGSEPGNVVYSLENFYYPFDAGLVVFAGQASAAHALNENVGLSMNLWPRWLNYRT